ncbi:MAG TPA: hypothetical protein VFW98_02285, partial [Gemmatimonadaceae bacterium]|nr:hypothetical protein [Gemmatimonadaceae bacterium]
MTPTAPVRSSHARLPNALPAALLALLSLLSLGSAAPLAAQSALPHAGPTAPPRTTERSPASRRASLDDGWRIQSSAHVTGTGATIARTDFDTHGWHAATLPATVLAALVADSVYENPYFGMNLRRIPGTTYPIGNNFSHLEMSAGSPFAVPWWYRKTF